MLSVIISHQSRQREIQVRLHYATLSNIMLRIFDPWPELPVILLIFLCTNYNNAHVSPILNTD